MKIELDNGRYTYIFDEKSGEQKALRHGEEWRDLTGDNLTYWMACRIVELEESNESMSDFLDNLPIDWEECVDE